MEMRGKKKVRICGWRFFHSDSQKKDFSTQSTSIATNIMIELYVGNPRWVEIDWRHVKMSKAIISALDINWLLISVKFEHVSLFSRMKC